MDGKTGNGKRKRRKRSPAGWPVVVCAGLLACAGFFAPAGILFHGSISALASQEDPLLLQICRANESDRVMETHVRYDRTSWFHYSDGSSRRVYSYRDGDRLLRLQEDIAVVWEKGEVVFYYPGPEPGSWEGTPQKEEDVEDPDMLRDQLAGAFTYDPSESTDLLDESEFLVHLETSSDPESYKELLDELGLTAEADDWMAFTYDMDPATLEMKSYTSSLMHADGTADRINEITWRYDGDVPEGEPEESLRTLGIK